MKITAVGIDLAKNVFQVHGIDGRGKVVLRKQLQRAQVAVCFASMCSRWRVARWITPSSQNVLIVHRLRSPARPLTRAGSARTAPAAAG
jgi:hypothetical protein